MKSFASKLTIEKLTGRLYSNLQNAREWNQLHRWGRKACTTKFGAAATTRNLFFISEVGTAAAATGCGEHRIVRLSNRENKPQRGSPGVNGNAHIGSQVSPRGGGSRWWRV